MARTRRDASRPGPPTLAGLAHELGIHVSTVSRALSSDPVGVSPATVRLVRDLAEAHGYRSNQAARALRTGRSAVLGMLVPHLTDQVLATVYSAADGAAIEAGYTTLVANTLDRADLRHRRVEMMLDRQVDAVLVADSLRESSAVAQLSAAGVPYVLALRCLDDQVCVGVDDVAGGRLVAEHLLDLGHRRVGVVAGDTRASTGAGRVRGFLEACAEAGVEMAEGAVVPCAFSVRGGAEAARQVLAVDPGVTAVFAASDNVALGVLGVLRDAGRSVPEDVALVGYNDLALAAALPVPLTSVDSRLTEVGEVAMRTLLAVLDGTIPESVRLEPRLLPRASSTGHVVVG